MTMKSGIERIGRTVTVENAKRGKTADMPGQRFGRLLVLSIFLPEKGDYRVLCRCDCGTETSPQAYSVRKGLTASCGCLGAEFREARAKAGQGRPRLFSDEERKQRRNARGAAYRASEAGKARVAAYTAKNSGKTVKRVAEWKLANPGRSAESARRRRVERGDEIREWHRAYRAKNKEKIEAQIKEWCERNKERFTQMRRAHAKHDVTVRRRLIGGQALARFYAAEIREIYRLCPPGHHVDHIIPLRSKIVCGLHIPVNLQYLPAGENASKGNKFDPDQYEAKYAKPAAKAA
jgi:hypothetical protein